MKCHPAVLVMCWCDAVFFANTVRCLLQTNHSCYHHPLYTPTILSIASESSLWLILQTAVSCSFRVHCYKMRLHFIRHRAKPCKADVSYCSLCMHSGLSLCKCFLQYATKEEVSLWKPVRKIKQINCNNEDVVCQAIFLPNFNSSSLIDAGGNVCSSAAETFVCVSLC